MSGKCGIEVRVGEGREREGLGGGEGIVGERRREWEKGEKGVRGEGKRGKGTL